MAVRLVNKEFYGPGRLDRRYDYEAFSTDTKPTTSLPNKATFHELNTGQHYNWDGSNWIEDLTLINALTEALG